MQTRPKTGGRKKGTKNKVTRNIKEALLQSFEHIGGFEYLATQAYENPTAYMSLLAKLLPTQLEGSAENPIRLNLSKIDDDVLRQLLDARLDN